MSSTPVNPRPTYGWWIVLCLVGLDYFSSLAYLPSIALHHVGDLAPLAGVGVVIVTLLGAVPVYWYVVGRSPHGRGGVGLLEERMPGWSGKLLMLAMLGFVATDFILTRTLSVSDATTHIVENSVYREVFPEPLSLANLLPGKDWEWLHTFGSEQLILTILLSILAFGLYHFMVQTLSRGFVGVAVGVVGLYLLVNAVVITSGLHYLRDNPALLESWLANLRSEIGDYRVEAGNSIGMVLLLALLAFPPMAIGLSGFELTMASAPTVKSSPGDDPERPSGRIWRTRLLMVAAALIMCLFVLGALQVVAMVVPREALGQGSDVKHRALAYLAHGEKLSDGHFATRMNGWFGPRFGTLYDISTVLILCLAGATATISLRDLVPEFLAKFGMQLSWAHRLGVITHLLNGMILVVTVAFKASVGAQLWAYAAAVLALLFGASLAAVLDIRFRWKGSAIRWLVQFPFLLTTLLFSGMLVLITLQKASGVGIALLFVAVILVTAIVSRWMRSTEMRFEGFLFEDDPTKQRWDEICQLELQVLVPHDPTHASLKAKEAEVRRRHRIEDHLPIIYIEVEVGDPSDFFQKPVMKIVRDEEGRELIRVTRATSVAHVIAAIGLAFREVGHPPEFYFKWSTQSPMEATMNFLVLGQGNIPFLVRALIHRAEPDPVRRPRVIVADA